MKIIFEAEHNEPITDLAIANCIVNYITDVEWSGHEEIEVEGKKVLVEKGDEQRNIERHIRTIANALLVTTENVEFKINGVI